MIEIANCIRFAAASVRYGRPPIQMSLPASWFVDYRGPEPDLQDGLIASYLAECDKVGIPQRIPVLDYLMQCFQLEDRMFDCRAALSFLDNKECTRDVLALASALKYSTWFTSFVSIDFPLKNDGAAALATMFDNPSSFVKLVLVNAKLSKPAMQALATRLSTGSQALEHISICKNPISDAGVTALIEALEAGKHVPSILELSASDIGVKGVKSLARVFSLPEWASGLQMLDLSDNPLGKSGTEALAQWLSLPSVRLEQLVLRKADVDFEKLFSALVNNKMLIHTTLALLDISGNKLSKKAMPDFTNILQTAKCLGSYSLSDCHLEHKQIIDILDAVIANRNRIAVALDLSHNDIGPKGAKDIQTRIAAAITRDPTPLVQDGVLFQLNLSDNSLGNEGIDSICKALQGTAIRCLKLDRNFKPGLFSTKGQDAADALASFVTSTPTLTELSIAGDDHTYYMGKFLLPVLNIIGQHPSLQQLDVQLNRIGDEGVMAIAGALGQSASIRGFNLDGSRMSLTALSVLHRAVSLNRVVTDMIIPVADLDRILRSVAQNRVGEVKAVVRDLDSLMDRNEMLQNQSWDETSNMVGDVDHSSNACGSSSSSLASSSSSIGGHPSSTGPNSHSSGVGSVSPSESEAKISTVPQDALAASKRYKRKSVAADSYEAMMAGFKSGKSQRKIISSNFEKGAYLQGLEQDIEEEAKDGSNAQPTSPSSASPTASLAVSSTPPSPSTSTSTSTASTATSSPNTSSPAPAYAPIPPPPRTSSNTSSEGPDTRPRKVNIHTS